MRSALDVGEDEGDEDGERSCGGGERARLKAAAIARGVDVSSWVATPRSKSYNGRLHTHGHDGPPRPPPYGLKHAHAARHPQGRETHERVGIVHSMRAAQGI